MKRRSFLKRLMATASILSVGGLGVLAKKNAVPLETKDAARLLKRFFYTDKTIFHLGEVYTKANPQLRPRDCLNNILDSKELPTILKKTINRGGAKSMLFEAVKKSREEDISQGALVTVDNWFLTPTEANLYALFYLCLSSDAQ